MASKIKKDDLVKILVGKDKGKEGKVLQVLPSKNKVIVEGLNILKKHKKKTDKGEGGIFDVPSPLEISNVALICPVKKVPTKVGFTILKDGNKKRFSKVSGETI